MNGRTDVVNEARKRQLGAPRASPDLVFPLEDPHGQARLGEGHRSREPVRPGADDDGV